MKDEGFEQERNEMFTLLYPLAIKSHGKILHESEATLQSRGKVLYEI